MSYSLHDIRIAGIKVQEVLSLSIAGEMGEHGTLQLSTIIEKEEDFVLEKSDLKPIKVYLIHETKNKLVEKSLFCGVITEILIQNYGGVLVAEISGKSKSLLTDLKKRSESFQDTSIKYSTLVKKILLHYAEAKSFIKINDKPISEFMIQYEETDWQFLKRTLSQLEVTLTPASEYDGFYIYAGVPELESFEIPYKLLQVEKDLNSYYELKANHQKVNDTYYTVFLIESPEIRRMFEQIVIQGQKFTIKGYQYVFTKSEMRAQYLLQKPQGLKVRKSYPMHLIGAAIEGTIVKPDKDKVQVKLDIYSKSKRNTRSIIEKADSGQSFRLT